MKDFPKITEKLILGRLAHYSNNVTKIQQHRKPCFFVLKEMCLSLFLQHPVYHIIWRLPLLSVDFSQLLIGLPRKRTALYKRILNREQSFKISSTPTVLRVSYTCLLFCVTLLTALFLVFYVFRTFRFWKTFCLCAFVNCVDISEEYFKSVRSERTREKVKTTDQFCQWTWFDW